MQPSQIFFLKFAKANFGVKQRPYLISCISAHRACASARRCDVWGAQSRKLWKCYYYHNNPNYLHSMLRFIIHNNNLLFFIELALSLLYLYCIPYLSTHCMTGKKMLLIDIKPDMHFCAPYRHSFGSVMRYKEINLLPLLSW